MPIAKFALGPLETNCYVVNNNEEAIVIDVGGDPAPIRQYLAERGLNLLAICLTHKHFDHTYGVAELAAGTGAPVYASRHDACLDDTESVRGGIWGLPPVPPYTCEDIPAGERDFGKLHFTILETPGHTPGGISLYYPAENAVFTGDALFFRSIGRTDFPGGDQALLLRSIREKLFTLPEETSVYPGHGGATTLGDERRQNAFCGDLC
ncbi:MBL fold metallo-hydrolase [uncultured Desulfovibrio sp.]|uniref:MBL fold metallo-hydrolase n=1 Tax=Candidatus Desulfovibrio intestinavium TaxID=2838534 RepID=A0A9D2HQ13_9BACT|nr:MBL fold metallo-hydrolase [uncultured Desulfovibrio sp.]HJA80095.1 MBL fold metallo-hydrolase [Candidatus Desulfovibrio intestinavium]